MDFASKIPGQGKTRIFFFTCTFKTLLGPAATQALSALSFAQLGIKSFSFQPLK